MSTEGLTVVTIPENRFSEVMDHLWLNFFADEPLHRALGFCQQGGYHFKFEEHCLQTLKQGYSRMLIDQKGTIAGCILNGIVQRGEREEAERRIAEISNEKSKTILGLLYKLNEKIDLFSKYNVYDLFECCILSVDDRFRGKGLANMLVKDSLKTARNSGFKVLKADASGLYSQKAFLKHGFQTVTEIPYSEIDASIRPDPPHRALKLLVKILE